MGGGGALRGLLPDPLVESLLAARRALPAGAVDRLEARAGLSSDHRTWPLPRAAGTRLLVGPVNYAGQGDRWARAAERLPDVAATSMSLDNEWDFPVDVKVPFTAYTSSAWGREQQARVEAGYTHVLLEAARPVLGLRHGLTARRDVRVLRRAGLAVAHVAHGSDVRDPVAHAQRVRNSPFRQDPAAWKGLGSLAARNRKVMLSSGAPVFVSTPDLLIDLPAATWCPLVIDVDRWAGGEQPMTRPRPVVMHAATSGPLKGSAHILPVLERLDAEGLIEMRVPGRVPHAQMAELVRSADILVDQCGIGTYGVGAVEAMAAGRVIVSQVGIARTLAEERTTLELPIVETRPSCLEQDLRALVADRDRARELAAAGPAYAAAVHDGRFAARSLSGFLSPSGSR